MLFIFIAVGVMVFAFLIIFIVVNKFLYKHIVQIKEIMADGSKRITLTKARDWYTDNKRVKYWKIKGERDPIKKLIPVPPNEVIDLTNKGKNFISVYRTETGEYIYSKDKVKISSIPDKFYDDIEEEYTQAEEAKHKKICEELKLKKGDKYTPPEMTQKSDEDKERIIKAMKKAKLENWLNDTGAAISFKPHTTNQRSMQTSNIRKAEERRMKGGLERMLPLIAIGVIVIFQLISLALFLVFWGDITAPGVQAQAQKTAQITAQKETLQIIKEIKQDVQIIKTNEGIAPTKSAKPPN